MQKRIILTEHSREVVEPGVQWVQQYPSFVSGIQLKPVPLDLSDTKQNFAMLNGHMQFGPVKEDTKSWSPIRALVGGGTEGGTFAPPKIGSSESDNKLLGFFPVKRDSGPVKNFAFPNGYINNISAVHEGNKPFYCSSCNQTFIRKFSLRRHIASIHEGKKPFFCITCKTTFSLNSSLKRHVASVHEGLEFSCSFCGKTNKERSKLRKHILSSHGNIPGVEIIPKKALKSESTSPANRRSEYIEENIKYSFAPIHEVKNPHDFITNVPKLHEGKKPFFCIICNTSFSLKSSLKRHVASVHEGLKFSCSLCGKTFGQLFRLNKHISVSHGNMSVVHEEKMSFSCINCNTTFRLKSSLKRHVASVHEGLKFSCSFCGKTLTEMFKIRRHISKSHGNNPDIKIIQMKTQKSDPTTANSVQNPSLITQIDPGTIIRTIEEQPITNYDAKNWAPIRALGRGGNEGALATLEFRGSEKIVTERNIDNLLLSLLPIKQNSGPVKHEIKNWSPITALVGGGTEGALAPLEFGGSEKITEREIDTILLGLSPIKQ